MGLSSPATPKAAWTGLRNAWSYSQALKPELFMEGSNGMTYE